MKTLDHFSERSLILFASMLANREARVFLSERLTQPMVVALESDSVGLRPPDAHLYDLCLGARLLRRRADAREWQGAKGHIPHDIVAAWTREENHRLQQDFPRIRELPGHHHPDRHPHPPTVVWRDVPLTQMEWNQGAFSNAGLSTFPGLSFENIGNDFPGLLQAIKNGQYPLQQFPDFPLPIVTLPVSVSVSHAYPTELEHMEETLNRNKHVEQPFIDCYIKKSEGVLDTELTAARYLTGLRLDPTRFADAVIARTRELPVRLFRNKERNHHPIFQPEEHLTIYGVDLNAVSESAYGRPRWSGHQVAFLSRIMQKLEVDYALIGFADRVIEAGQPVYLHLPITIKKVTDPFDGSFWSRLAHVFLSKALTGIPGEPAAYHPLQLQTIGAMFRQEEKALSHAFHCLIWVAPHGMPQSMGQFHAPEYWRSTSDRLDDQFARWKREFPGARWDNQFLFLVNELKLAGRKGGVVSEAQGW